MSRLSRLKQASDYKVEQWLIEELKLTPYQKEILRNEELVRFSDFYFFEQREKEKSNIFWRFTLPFYGVFLLLLIIFLPINFLFTGKFGYKNKLYSIVQYWKNKLKL